MVSADCTSTLMELKCLIFKYGIFNGYLVGSYFFDGTINGQNYLQFLQNDLPQYLENVESLHKTQCLVPAWTTEECVASF